jgi:hypothetical protein
VRLRTYSLREEWADRENVRPRADAYFLSAALQRLRLVLPRYMLTASTLCSKSYVQRSIAFLQTLSPYVSLLEDRAFSHHTSADHLRCRPPRFCSVDFGSTRDHYEGPFRTKTDS